MIGDPDEGLDEGQDLQGDEGIGGEASVEDAEDVGSGVQPGEGDQADQAGAEGTDRPLSRGDRRYQAIINENKRIREDAERHRLENEQFRQQQWQAQQNQQHDPAIIEQRIAAIEDPEQRINARLAWEQQKNQQALYQMQVQMFNQGDQAQLNSIVEKIPEARKYAQQVEQMFNAQPQMLGSYKFSRTDILDKLLGQERRENALKGTAKKAAQQRVEGQRVTPTSARGSVPASGGRTRDPVEAARQRLMTGNGGRPVVFD